MRGKTHSAGSRPGPWKRSLFALTLAIVCGSYARVPRKLESTSPIQARESQPTDSSSLHLALQDLGIPSTGGATPGYVADEVCSSCHDEIARSYQSVGMSRSFFAPDPKKNIENFQSKPFFHRPSSRYYQVSWRDGRLVFSQWQQDFKGDRINHFEIGVDWILGSGTRSRTYLYRTESGALFQLPLAWYTQSSSWGMAPGFDRPDHLGVSRRVRRECMFCHNAFPDVPTGSDGGSKPHAFPRQLPQGIGCQRCHGPGGRHVLAALEGGDGSAVRAAIVNPAKLDKVRRGDVCLQCHLQPSVALPRPRKFGRGDYSFRPGEALTDYLVPIDVRIENLDRADRFEINHHPYRLQQSRCFLESGGGLECLSCHDPHRKVAYAEAAAGYRKVCLGCHPDMSGPAHAPTTAKPAGLSFWGLDGDLSIERDCVVCHMPKRRPRDVVNVVMTDHRITRRMPAPEFLERPPETDPVLIDVALLDPARSPSGALGDLYCATAVCQVACPPKAAQFLEKTLLKSGLLDATPWMILAEAQIRLHRYTEAEASLGKVLTRDPSQASARESLALALAGEGRFEESIDLLRTTLDQSGERAETLFNLGSILLRQERYDEARPRLLEAVRLGPTMVEAWLHLGDLQAHQGGFAEAADCYKKVLALDARKTQAYLGLGKALLKLGKRDEAIRYWRQGLRSAADTGPVAKALRDLFRDGKP